MAEDLARKSRASTTLPGKSPARSIDGTPCPRTSKFGYWSNEAQAGDSSTTGSLSAGGRGVARGGGDRRRQRAGDLVGHLAVERPGEIRAPPRRSDRPCGCAGRIRRGWRCRRSSACRRRSRKYRVKLASALAALSALVALEVVDEQHVALAADLLHAVREAGETRQAFLDCRQVEAERDDRRRSRRRRSARCARRAASRCRRDRATACALPPARAQDARCPSA